MSYYRYKARGFDGKVVTGLVDSPTKEAAARLIREKKLIVVELKETEGKVNIQAMLNKFKRVKFSDIVNFTRQLSTMTVAGLQLPESLSILRAQTDNPVFAACLADVEHQIVGGGNLADSFEKYPQYFSPVYISLVRAGESSGTLDKVLARLAENLEAQQEFRAKVKGAMIYPVIILIGMVVVVFIMMTVVIPKLSDMYREFGIDLPWATQLLMSISDLFARFWWLFILMTVGGIAFFSKWKKSAIGEFVVDSSIFKIPVIGELQKKIILTEFTRTFGMLVGAGIHVLDALKILRGILGNILFRNAIYEVGKRVEKGFSIGDSFAQHDIFPLIVPQMIKVGEETGKLDETLSKLSNYFQSESEHLVKGLTTAIEPIIMVILGIGVFFIVFSIITPIYNLTSQF